MANEDIYFEAAEKLGYPNSASCVKFLRVLFTPEEGELLLEFLEPATCEHHVFKEPTQLFRFDATRSIR